MPQGAQPPVNETWWLKKQFEEIDRAEHSRRLEIKRQLRDWIYGQLELRQISADDLISAMEQNQAGC